MLRKIITLSFIGGLIFLITHTVNAQGAYWDEDSVFTVSAPTLPAYKNPSLEEKAQFDLYRGMAVEPLESKLINGVKWFKIDGNFWVPAAEPMGKVNVTASEPSSQIIDLYGIMQQPHRYAVKMVKEPGAVGRMETYKKTENGYVLQHTYPIFYRKEGQKSRFGDLKSPGGNVIRYMYRTTKSGMNGWDKNGESFGVYKISYPMPHDALPHLEAGRISVAQYNKIPAINYVGNDDNKHLIPHPHSYMGADIVLHTKNKGSAGCINIENEAMSFFYHDDVVTENDKEIIPLIIYDEDVAAPPIGELF